MPHVREFHLEDFCTNCKKPHGNKFEIVLHGSKIYELIFCDKCGYEIFREKVEGDFVNKLDYVTKRHLYSGHDNL